jgi:signal transduction histidine kinase/CheY-like chemotaxis protein
MSKPFYRESKMVMRFQAVRNWIEALGRTGVKPDMEPLQAEKIIICNYTAYLNVLTSAPYFWILTSLGAPWLSLFIIPLAVFFLVVPELNRLGFTTVSRIILITVINVDVYLYTASVGMESSIQNVFFFTLVAPLMLFQVLEWGSILFCVSQPLLFWALLVDKGTWFIPQTNFEPWALKAMAPAISFTSAIMLFASSFLVSLLHQRSVVKLRRAKEEAEESERTKSRFLATMSHEIRTPMNGIFGVLQGMEQSGLTPSQKSDMKVIQSSGELLLSIINDILDFSKMDARKLTLEMRPFHLVETTQSVKKMFEALAKEKGLNLELKISNDCPTWVVGDEIRFRQLVMNLTNNAIKFTKTGSVHILLSRKGGIDTDPGIRLIVKDTGIGMNAATLAKLFQPFTQGDSSTTREYGGTGLGLAISKTLATAMDGILSVESIFNQGSIFQFTANFKSASGPDAQELASISTVNRSIYAGFKALVVEDNLVNQFAATNLLAKLGFSVATALNGKEAIDMATANYFDLILMDCHMPIMDGYFATRAIRAGEKSGSRVLIVALTANNLPENRKQCLDAGMDDFISKPILLNALLDILRKRLKEKGAYSMAISSFQ